MSQIHIKIYRSPTVTEFLKFDPNELRIGRGSKNTIVIDDDDISRNHCTMNFEQGRWWVKDLGSTNGSYVNGLPVQERALKVGDAIILGSTRLHIVDPNILSTGEEEGEEEALLTILSKRPPTSAFSWVEEKQKSASKAEQEQLALINSFKNGWLNIPELYSLDIGLSSKKSINNLAQRVVADVTELIPKASFGVILWMNEHTKEFDELAEQSENPGKIEPNKDIVESVASDQLAMHANVLHGPSHVQVIAVPIVIRSDCKGLLYLGMSGWENGFTDSEFDLVCLFSLTVATSIDNLSKIKSLQRQIDSLAASPGQGTLQQSLFDADRTTQISTVVGANVNELERRIKRLAREAKQLKELVAPEHPAHATVEKLTDELDASRIQCDHLLTFCRRGVVKVPQFNPSQILNEVFIVTKEILGEKVWLESDIPDRLPSIEFDVVRFEQIIVQLITFAKNSMPDGGMIRVTAEAYTIKEERVDNYGSMNAGECLRVMLESTGDIHLSDTGKNETSLSNEDYLKLIQIRDVMNESKSYLATETQLQGGTFVLLYFAKK